MSQRCRYESWRDCQAPALDSWLGQTFSRSRNSSIRRDHRWKIGDRGSLPRIKHASEDSFERLEKTSKERGEKATAASWWMTGLVRNNARVAMGCKAIGCNITQGGGVRSRCGKRTTASGPRDVWVHASLIAELCTTLATVSSNRTECTDRPSRHRLQWMHETPLRHFSNWIGLERPQARSSQLRISHSDAQ